MRFRFAVLLVPVLAAVAFGACSNQGEGQVCDHRASNNGNDDCQDGLVCTTGIPGVNGDRCCPPDRTTATTTECKITQGGVDASVLPPDAATGDDGASAADAPMEAAPDGPAESSTTDARADAPADAPAESAAESGAADASDAASE